MKRSFEQVNVESSEDSSSSSSSDSDLAINIEELCRQSSIGVSNQKPAPELTIEGMDIKLLAFHTYTLLYIFW